MNKYYTPSGNFSLSAIAYFLGISLIGLPILGLLYAYLIWYIPFIYINMFIAVGFGMGMAFLTNIIITKGKIRSPKIAFILSIIVGLIGLYFHWAVWADLVLNISDTMGNDRLGISISNIKILQVFDLALNPIFLFELIKEINEYGTWGIRSATVSGIVLSIFWLVETGIIMYMAVNTAANRASLPFEESTDTWYKEEVLAPKAFISNTADLVSNLEYGKEDTFNELESATNPDKENHSVFYLYSSVNEGNYLTIENNIATINKKNEIEFNTSTVVKNIYISNSIVEDLTKKVLA